MANYSNSNPVLIQCTFLYNWSNQGGAINNYNNCSLQIKQSTLEYNAADLYGGAVSNQNFSDTELSHCKIFNNAAPSGGALYNDQSNLRMVNCVAFGNNAVQEYGGLGGVLYNNIDANSVTITNCTFVDNIAAEQAGASLYNESGDPVIQNTILWDGVDGLYVISGAPTISYSCIQGGWSGAGTNNIAADPCLVSIPEQLRLLPSSPCIDAGNNTSVLMETDFDGRERLNDGNCDGSDRVDIGAYEFDLKYFGDYYGDCDVNFEDFAVLTQNWYGSNPEIDIMPYLDPDGIINLEELRVLIENWLVVME
jgi:hypothetical protein